MKWACLYENDYFESSIIWLKLHMHCRSRIIIAYFVAINGIDYKSYIWCGETHHKWFCLYFLHQIDEDRRAAMLYLVV